MKTHAKIVKLFRNSICLLFPVLIFVCSKPAQSQNNNIGIDLINAISLIDSTLENEIWPKFKPQKYIYKLTDSLGNVFGIGFSPNAESPNREKRAFLVNNYLKNISKESAFSLSVHEAFHSFQEASSNEKNKWLSENPSLIKDYDELSARNNVLLNIEGDLLFEALHSVSKDSLIDKLGYFIAVRNLRQKELGSQLKEFEKGAESNEGLAEYVGVKSVILCLESKSYSQLPMQFSITDSKKHLTDTYQVLKNLSSIKRNIRRRFYYSGSAQAFLLDKILPNWKSKFLKKNKAPQNLIEEYIKQNSPQSFDVNVVLELYNYNKRVTKEQTSIDEKRNKNLAILDSLMNKKTGQIIINISSLGKMADYLGFDPMNMISVDKQTKIHPQLSVGLDDYFNFESNNNTIEKIDSFEYFINSAYNNSISIIADGKQIAVSSLNKPIHFKQLKINSPQFSLEMNYGFIQEIDKRLTIKIKKPK